VPEIYHRGQKKKLEAGVAEGQSAGATMGHIQVLLKANGEFFC